MSSDSGLAGSFTDSMLYGASCHLVCCCLQLRTPSTDYVLHCGAANFHQRLHLDWGDGVILDSISYHYLITCSGLQLVLEYHSDKFSTISMAG